MKGFGGRFVEPPVGLQDTSRVRHLHKLNLNLEGEAGAQVTHSRDFHYSDSHWSWSSGRICRAGGLILCHTIFRRASQVSTRWMMHLVSEAAFGVTPHGCLKWSSSVLLTPWQQGGGRKPTEETMEAWSFGTKPMNSRTLEISDYVAKVWEIFGSTWIWENTLSFRNLLKPKLRATVSDANGKSGFGALLTEWTSHRVPVLSK